MVTSYNRDTAVPLVDLNEEESFFIGFHGPVASVESDVLHLSKASRLHMGPYLCIASNGVPPSVSQRVTLKIQCKSSIHSCPYSFFVFCFAEWAPWGDHPTICVGHHPGYAKLH